MKPEELSDLLGRTVRIGDADKAYGDINPADARGMADILKEIRGGGVEVRVGPVAIAWRELAKRLEDQGLATVSELEPDEAAKFARRVWVILL